MTGDKALGISMSIGKIDDLVIPTMPVLAPSDPTTLALEVIVGELINVCERINSLFAKLRGIGLLEKK